MRAPWRVLVVGVLAVAVLVVAPAVQAKAGNTMSKPMGVLWDRHAAPKKANPFRSVGSLGSPVRRLLATCPKAGPDPACNLTYHNGAVVLGPHTTYVVYWEPAGSTVSANYHSLINRYFTDVAADSGRATNVYATDTQYNDSTNAYIQYQQTFGGSFVDTTAFPAVASNCTTTDGTLTALTCLTQTQEATELDNFIQAKSLPRGLNVIYFLVLPKNVETCYDDGSDCGNYLNTSPRYCAYHSSFNISGHGLTLWANEPYINIAAGHCDSGNRSSPNGDDADHALNAISHEQNETITDPTSGGWFDADGTGENGDKCNFTYGPAIASNANGAYNQLINHNPYEIQQEWSNATTGCVSNYLAVAPTAAFTSSPGSPKALDTVSFDGTTSSSNNVGGYIISYDWTFGDGATATGASPTHAYATAGNYSVTLSIEDDAGLKDSVSHTVTVVQRPTTLGYTGGTTVNYHDAVTLSGHLTDAATAAGISGKSVTFTLGSQSCSGTTNGSGDASCSLTAGQVPAAYTVTAAYTGDSVYAGSSGTSAFTITREETTLSYTGPTVILAGSSNATVTARLDEDGANDSDADGGASAPVPAGQSVTFTLGAQSCTGTVLSTGVASCAIAGVSAATLGSKTLTATFGGDTYYTGSTASAAVIVFAFPTRGAFTLGDLTTAAATPSTQVSWWSDSWWALNALTAGTAPLSFKGFADTPAGLPTTSPAAACSSTFTTAPGNSPPPTAGVPSYMGVLVSGAATKNGSTVSGSWSKIVVVKTNPGYAPTPGHPGTGTIVANFCG